MWEERDLQVLADLLLGIVLPPCSYMSFFSWESTKENVRQSLYLPSVPTRTLLLLPILPMPYLISTCWGKALQKSVLTELVLISLGMLAAEYCVKWISFLLTLSLLSTGNANAAVFPIERFF